MCDIITKLYLLSCIEISMGKQINQSASNSLKLFIKIIGDLNINDNSTYDNSKVV